MFYLLSAVIDTLRMLVLHPDGATILFKHVEANNGTEFGDRMLCFHLNVGCENIFIFFLC